MPLDREVFVQNVKHLCELKGTKQTVACRESGVSVSFINEINRGQTPSVTKVQMLANYLGVTTSELLGEVPMGAYSKSEAEITQTDIKLSKTEQTLLHSFRQMNADGQERVVEYSSALLASGRYSLEGGGERLA